MDKFTRNQDNGLRELSLTALFMALILVSTLTIRIPIPLTQGYVHLGDAMIYLGVCFLSRRNAVIAASIGSAMADIMSGYAMWVPWTLVVKAIMAFLTATIFRIHGSGDNNNRLRDITAMTAGGLFMTFGYFIAEAIMYGNPMTALLGVPWNIGQFAIGIGVFSMIATAVKRIIVG